MKTKILALAAAVALFAVLTPFLGAGQAAAAIKGVAFQKTDKGFDVTIAVQGEFAYQVQVLAAPTRLAVDLSPISKIDAPAYAEASQAGLISVRTGWLSGMIARVMFDFSGALPGYEIAKTEAGLIIRFSKEPPPAVGAPPVVVPAPVRDKPVPPVKPSETKAETEAADVREGFANTMIGVGLGSYQIPSEQFSEIYGTDAAKTFGLSLSRTLVQYQALSLDVEGGIRFYSKTGAATESRETTTFKMKPISLALRLNYVWKYVQAFAGYGLDWYGYTESSAIANTTGSANGHHFTAGIYFRPPVLDGMLRLKAYYKFTKVTATSNGISVDLGGNEYGLGLSLGFNLFKKGVLSF